MDRRPGDPAAAHPGGRQLDDQRDPPEQVARRLGHQHRHQPDRGPEGEGGQVQVEQRPGGGRVAAGPGVEDQDDAAHGHEGQGEAGRAAVQGVVEAERHGDDGQHPGQHQDPVQQVVGVEPVGVDGVADPGPPHGHEQAGRAREVGQGAVVLQGVDDLGDRDDEDQVEEQLEPGRVPLVLLGVEGPQLWRSQPPPPCRRPHQPSTYMITCHLSGANSGRPPGIPHLGPDRPPAPVVASFDDGPAGSGAVPRRRMGPREPKGCRGAVGPALEGGRWWAWSRCGRRRRSGSSAPT